MKWVCRDAIYRVHVGKVKQQFQNAWNGIVCRDAIYRVHGGKAQVGGRDKWRPYTVFAFFRQHGLSRPEGCLHTDQDAIYRVPTNYRDHLLPSGPDC